MQDVRVPPGRVEDQVRLGIGRIVHEQATDHYILNRPDVALWVDLSVYRE
jgi:hypothetical protein